MIKVKDLVKGQIYALRCPMNNYVLKPFIFDCTKPSRNSFRMDMYECYFFGIDSPNLIYPIGVLLEGTKVLDYGWIDAALLTPLEVELL